MFNIVLIHPDIPPNTGNIIRLCANTGCQLHLIHPLGFKLDDKRLKRAGLDYHEFAELKEHQNYQDFLAQCSPLRLFAIETGSIRTYNEVKYQAGDYLLFGSELTGIPKPILAQLTQENILSIPMLPNNRSLNLSNSVALVVYEAWRQLNFAGY
ncbi:MAG: tRNA (uridine(34)/cytosine(34)/5-carboxymethylaminomethyluridine(34)-2'-O)-methyltransferase TrmL [Gammaproteobacteria bacterium RIFCSPHIGHO2_12_FULL_35_23]|nr:MAG: tRNA (uridine(34)/cytosine(34)/5-carboxymethylaminomethyluridine(34)-2'-O)-methyltransferase TrmL [Gammaproteobacteria bacterium RIFCSPHIGHO2_12_FULL_35_23]